MTRLVFQLADSVAPDNKPYVALSLEEPPAFGSPALPFTLTLTDPAFAALTQAVIGADAVRSAGRALFDAVAQHPQLQATLSAALLTQLPARFPVLIEIATGSGAEALPWETLCSDKDEWLGLDERWAVARLVAGPVRSAPVWYVENPVRVAAVLSCLNVPARDEWNALLRGLTSTAGIYAEVLLLVSEEQLFQEVTAATPAHVTVEVVPTDVAALQARMCAFRPQVVHFFCHGSISGGPHLQVAAKNDWESGTPVGSLVVEARDIHGFAALTDDQPWVVVLNCCESAAGPAGGGLQSLALNLVYDGGVPVVIGMREPVASGDASLFTETFHMRLMSELAATLGGAAPGGGDLDVGAMTVHARTELARKHLNGPLKQAAGSTKQWTLPVVYMRTDPVAVRAMAPNAAVGGGGLPGGGGGLPGGGGGLPGGGGGFDGAAGAGDGGEDAGGGEGVAPAPADDSDPTRALRLELEALRGLLAGLPPQAPPGLRQEAEARIVSLSAELAAP